LVKQWHERAPFLGNAPQCRALFPTHSMNMANSFLDGSLPFGAFRFDFTGKRPRSRAHIR
jgi:hypothetical protein